MMIKTASTYKELREIAEDWSTLNISNDYITGSDHFTLKYEGKVVYYQNNDIKNVANCALNYNGLSWSEYMKFTNRLQTVSKYNQ